MAWDETAREMAMTHSGRAFSWSGLLVTLMACGGGQSCWVTPTPTAEKEGQQVHITGIVRHLEQEGGFYAIEDPTQSRTIRETFLRNSRRTGSQRRRMPVGAMT